MYCLNDDSVDNQRSDFEVATLIWLIVPGNPSESIPSMDTSIGHLDISSLDRTLTSL